MLMKKVFKIDTSGQYNKTFLLMKVTNFYNKLERLSVASLPASYMFVGKAGAYLSEALFRYSSLG
jgi:hypothetical protein